MCIYMQHSNLKASNIFIYNIDTQCIHIYIYKVICVYIYIHMQTTVEHTTI